MSGYPQPSPAPAALAASSVCLLVIDSHAPSRIGLATLLERQPWIYRSLVAGGGKEAVELARRHRPDIAIVDVSEAGPFAVSTIAAVKTASPGARILVTSRCRTSPDVALASLGAFDFLPAGISEEGIVGRVVAALLDGEADSPDPLAAPVALTDREREILILFGTGATNREIAESLHLGPDTIKKSAGTLYRKLGVRNRTEAVRRASTILAA